ncbi:MAG: 2-oxoacid:acceptor oxidoreductase subunit alpha [Nitrososphaerales archaeon]
MIMATKLEQATGTETLLKDDICLMVGGQGGDGSLTVVNLLARVFRNIGLNVYDARNVLSRIRGGHADGVIRASVRDIFSTGDQIDVLVAFDEEAVQLGLNELAPDATIIFDSSKGELSEKYRRSGFSIFSAPMGNMAASHLRKNIFKNTIAFAVLGRVLGLGDSLLTEVVRVRYERRGKEALDSNLKALELGYEYANQNFKANPYELKHGTTSGKILATGNEAAAFGFLVGGGRFFIGYPITPATDIMEWLAPRLPKFGGVVKQAEDELAVINMGIGAACAGARVMVATSGPGQSLMTEGVGHAGEAEVPLVVVECQRVGPSTGQPTKNEQSDVNHVVYGSHGEFPRIVIAPGNATECFYMTADALNLAERYQLPVFILLDQALCQNSESIEPFNVKAVKVDRGKIMTEAELKKLEIYKRYQFTDDGVSPRSIPSQEGGQFQVTGNEHNEFGLVSVDKTNRLRMMMKRMKKLEMAKAELPRGNNFGRADAKIGIIGFGSTFGAIMESIERLQKRGILVRFHQIRTIYPLLDEDLNAFVDPLDRVFVVENNFQGQLAGMIRSAIRENERVESITKFDGTSFKPKDIAGAILTSLQGPRVSEDDV